jgi:hypothetical protein
MTDLTPEEKRRIYEKEAEQGEKSRRGPDEGE